jgi:thiamine pyrophosphate-dependent acetolactate synthase large subunit-like protein
MKRHECLQALAPLVGNRVAVTNIGPTCSEWPTIRPGDANLVAAQLGTLTAISLGLAVGLARAPKPLGVVALDGDGNLMFAPGVLATVAHAGPPGLVIFVFDNGCYESTGGQPTVTGRGADIEQVAKGFGIKSATTVSTLDEFTDAARKALNSAGPHVIVARIEPSRGRREFIGSGEPSTVDGIENKFRLARYIEAQTGARVLHGPEYASGFSPNVGRN